MTSREDRDDAVLENDGFCPCCRTETTFRATERWLRDFYVCTNCFSIPRLRHLQTILDTRFPGWEALTIHESSPSADFIDRYAQDYSSSQYFPGVASGDFAHGVQCENVENLSFADESIDLFITQDVLEHVFDPAQAIREIHRVLRPGGAHVFTAPKHKGLLQTRQRAVRLADDQVEHLLEAEYHGSPVGDHRILVTYDYGYDFEALLSTWSGVSVEAIHTVDRTRGIDADFNEVFVILKPPSPAPLRLTEQRLAELQRELATRAEAAQRLDQELATWRAANHDLVSSTSWRVTAPLRRASRKLASIRAKTRQGLGVGTEP